MPTSRIILLLDESGSMNCQRNDIIDGINVMINTQKKLQDTDLTLDIFKFNETVKHYISSPLSKLPAFTSQDYRPDGLTALYDAVGLAISKYKNEKDVIMVIATDGLNNASKEYKHSDMLSIIDTQRIQKDWTFVYLSEDPTTVVQGDTIGFKNSSYGCSNVYIGPQQSGKNIGSDKMQCYLRDVCMAKKKGTTVHNYNSYHYL
jgi:hypothetical protein